jgi:hypothetical protein
MRRFAEYDPQSGIIRCVFDWPLDGVDPQYDPEVAQAVEVTDLDPEPGHGWTYAEGAFTPPEPEPEPAPEPPAEPTE